MTDGCLMQLLEVVEEQGKAIAAAEARIHEATLELHRAQVRAWHVRALLTDNYPQIDLVAP